MVRGCILALLFLCIAAESASAAQKARKKRAPGPAPATHAVRLPPDPFLSCDVRVRDSLRNGGTVVNVTKIVGDTVLLQLRVSHEYGEAGKNAVPLQGETERERREHLNRIKVYFQTVERAAAEGRVWYLIVPDASRGRLAPDADSAKQWTGLVFADIAGQCQPLARFDRIDRSKLDPELNKKLDE